MQKTISFMQEEGAIFGYCVDSKAHNIQNYLSEFGDPKELCSIISSKYLNVALLKNLFVEEGFRGNGIGSNLLEKFIDSAYDLGANAIIVVPDIYDENLFNIQDWYSNSYDFETIYNLNNYPVMVKVFN